MMLTLCILLPAADLQGKTDRLQPMPVATVDRDTIDIGTLERGSRASGEIQLHNTGQADLLIGRVRSSCGLMVPAWPEEPVRPGESAVIRFRYDTRRTGPFERKVVIHTNARPHTLVVTVTGEIVPERDKNK